MTALRPPAEHAHLCPHCPDRARGAREEVMGLPFTPSGPSFWRGLKCPCGGKSSFIVWDQPKCGDCYRTLLSLHNEKLPWKEPGNEVVSRR